MYLGLTPRRDSCSRVSRTRVTAMINQNFRPAGAHCPSSVACCQHCRRGGRLNPFNDDARENGREQERRDIIGRDGPWGGPRVFGPRERKRRPLFRQGVSRVSVASPDLVSFLLPVPLFYFSKERSMAVAHSGNLSLGGVIDTMCRRDDRCVSIVERPDLNREILLNVFCYRATEMLQFLR